MEAKAEKINRDLSLKRILLAGGETANAMKLSYILGVGLGAIGRGTGEELIPAIPPVLDTFQGTIISPGRVACYSAYGLGVATAYVDKVYSAVAEIINKV